MPGEHELDHLLERYSNAQCLIGEILEVQPGSPEALETAVRLSDAGDGRRRVVIVAGRSERMFPDFVHGHTVRVVCQLIESTDSTILYDFLHLVHVDGLTRQQEIQLWPWRDSAHRLLVDPYVRLSQFEEELCRSLTCWGRPPSEKQRSIFRQISERQSGRKSVSRESLLRVTRHRPRPHMMEPQPIGEALLSALGELRQIWLESRP